MDARSNDLLLRKGLHKIYPVVLMDLLKFLLGLACVAVIALTDYELMPLLVLGVVLSLGAFPTMRRCQAFLTGWYEGRRAMVGSLREATDRDMPFLAWVEAEMDRTLAAVGVEVMHSVPEEEPPV